MINLSPDQVLPQRDTMQLIDKVIEINDDFSRCEMQVRDDNIFYEPAIKGIYAWIGIELMAQTVAAFAGFHSTGNQPSIGLLLSVRQYKHKNQSFSLGDKLIIQANKIYLEDNIGVFNCEILYNNKCLASAKLNTYQPAKDKLAEILLGNKKS